MRVLSIIILSLLASAAAHAKEERKAEIIVSNGRTEPLVMRFEYAFRAHTWKLMERPIPVGEDLTYRYPSHIPGCEKLHEWGIADGVIVESGPPAQIFESPQHAETKELLQQEAGG